MDQEKGLVAMSIQEITEAARQVRENHKAN
jgi:hypothetical protein